MPATASARGPHTRGTHGRRDADRTTGAKRLTRAWNSRPDSAVPPSTARCRLASGSPVPGIRRTSSPNDASDDRQKGGPKVARAERVTSPLTHLERTISPCPAFRLARSGASALPDASPDHHARKGMTPCQVAPILSRPSSCWRPPERWPCLRRRSHSSSRCRHRAAVSGISRRCSRPRPGSTRRANAVPHAVPRTRAPARRRTTWPTNSTQRACGGPRRARTR